MLYLPSNKTSCRKVSNFSSDEYNNVPSSSFATSVKLMNINEKLELKVYFDYNNLPNDGWETFLTLELPSGELCDIRFPLPCWEL